MNERLKALAEQAGITDNNLSDGNMSLTDLEKFAKLIIEEATDLVDNMLDQNTSGEVTVEIKQHFGVL